MEILNDVQKIFDGYDLKSLEFKDDLDKAINLYQYLYIHPDEEKDFKSDKTDGYFINKYKANIPRGWYGFSIGSPIFPAWLEILDQILELCIKNDKDFEIYQIKLKFGGIRFYTGSRIIEDINDVEDLIENKLYNEALIY